MRNISFLFLMLWVVNCASGQAPAYFEKNYLDAKQKAQQNNKLCAVLFTQDNSKSAAYMTSVVLEDAAVKKQMNQSYVGVITNVKDFDGKMLLKKWELSKAPSIAILNSQGKLVAKANHGLSRAKCAEFLQFYSLPGNAGKSVNYQDNSYEGEVADWQGYKGIDEGEEIPVPAATAAVSNNASKEAVPDAKPEKETRYASADTPPVTKPAAEAKPEPAKAADPVAEAMPEVRKTPEQPKKEMPAQEDEIASRNPSASKGEYRYLVQAGIFSVESSARSLITKINAQGGKAFIENVNQGDKIVYKVIAGKYYTEQEARDLIARLAGAGIQSFIKTIN